MEYSADVARVVGQFLNWKGRHLNLRCTTPEMVRTLVGICGVDGSELNSYGLRWAAFAGHREVVCVWLDLCWRKLDFKHSNNELLQLTLRLLDPEINEKLLSILKSLADKGLTRRTMGLACYYNSIGVVKSLVEMGVDPNKNTYVVDALSSKSKDVLKYLLVHPSVACDGKTMYDTLIKMKYMDTETLDIVINNPRLDLGEYRDKLFQHYQEVFNNDCRNKVSFYPIP